eukprot:3304728-Amphidinium_carterae.1
MSARVAHQRHTSTATCPQKLAWLPRPLTFDATCSVPKSVGNWDQETTEYTKCLWAIVVASCFLEQSVSLRATVLDAT